MIGTQTCQNSVWTHSSRPRVGDVSTVHNPLHKRGFYSDWGLVLSLRKHSADVRHAVHTHCRQVGRVPETHAQRHEPRAAPPGTRGHQLELTFPRKYFYYDYHSDLRLWREHTVEQAATPAAAGVTPAVSVLNDVRQLRLEHRTVQSGLQEGCPFLL